MRKAGPHEWVQRFMEMDSRRGGMFRSGDRESLPKKSFHNVAAWLQLGYVAV